MSAGEFIAGLLVFAGTTGAVAAASAVIVRHRLAHLAGAPLLVAFSTLATFGLVMVHVVPGALGVLDRFTVLACALVLLALTLLVRRRWEAAEEPRDTFEPPASGMLSWVFAGSAVLLVAVTELGYLNDRLTLAPEGVDALNFHLPYVAEWIQSGSLWHVGHFTPGQATGNYPSNGNVVLLASILPWRSDFLVRPTLLPYLALTGVAVYAIAVELRAPRATAALLGAAVLAVPAIAVNMLTTTLPDVVLTFSFGAGLLFLLRHARTRSRSDLVLAGLGLGLAFGTKWFGFSSVVAVVALWAVASLLAGRGWRHVSREGALLGGLILAAGGFWLVRNLVDTGNPVFPTRLAPLGAELLSAPRDVVTDTVGLSIVHYLGKPSVWADYFWPAWREWLAGPGLLALGGTVVAAGAALAQARRRLSLDTGRRLAAVIGVGVLVAVYLVTPYTAFGPEGQPALSFVTTRYLDPAMVLAGALAACGLGAFGRLRPLAELAGVVAVVHGLDAGIGLPGGKPEGSVAGVFAQPPHSLADPFTIGITCLLVAAAVWLLASPRIRLRGPAARPLFGAAAAVAVVLGCATAAAAYRVEKRLLERRYAGLDQSFDWINAHAASHRRVGVAGYWSSDGLSPVFPSFGPRLRNRVAYVGPVVEGMLRTYSSRDAFTAHLRRERYDLLLVGRKPELFPGLPLAPPLERWAREAGFVPITESGRLVLLRAPTARR